jgi:hypothetical protein
VRLVGTHDHTQRDRASGMRRLVDEQWSIASDRPTKICLRFCKLGEGCELGRYTNFGGITGYSGCYTESFHIRFDLGVLCGNFRYKIQIRVLSDQAA